MKIIKNILTIVFVITLSNLTYARAGFSEDSFKTPGGHSICWCDPFEDDILPTLIGWEDTIPRIKEFYFYKDNIVGYTNDRYFIFNEKSEKIFVFFNEDDWKSKIMSLNLKPNKEKWLTIHDSKENVEYGFFMLFVLTIPIWIILFIIFIIQLIRKKITKKLLLYILIGVVLIIISVKYYVNNALDVMSY